MDTLSKNATVILTLLVEEKREILSCEEIQDLTKLSVKHINSAVKYLSGLGAIESDFGYNFGEFQFTTIKEGSYGESYYEYFNEETKGNDNIKNINSSNEGNNLSKELLKLISDSVYEKDIWDEIEIEYNISKRQFGKKINFVKEKFKRDIIFRDVGQAFYLAKNGFNKPAVILSGGVVEELLRLYLESHKIKSERETFEKYLDACIENKLLKSAISKLSESIRYFRNLVHLEKEKSKKHTLSKPTAIGAVSTIFSLINDFEPFKQQSNTAKDTT